MQPILILQNCSDEPPGTILDYLADITDHAEALKQLSYRLLDNFLSL